MNNKNNDLTKEARRERVKENLCSFGKDALTVTELSKSLGVSRQTVYNDIGWVFNNMPKEIVEREKIKTYVDFSYIDGKLMDLVKQNEADTDAFLKCVYAYLKFKSNKSEIYVKYKIFEEYQLKQYSDANRKYDEEHPIELW